MNPKILELDLPVLEAAQIRPLWFLCCYSVKDDNADLTEEPISHQCLNIKHPWMEFHWGASYTLHTLSGKRCSK